MKRLHHVGVYDRGTVDLPVRVVAFTFQRSISQESKTLPRNEVVSFELPIACTMQEAANALAQAIFDLGRRDT